MAEPTDEWHEKGRELRAEGWPRSVRDPVAILAGALVLQLALHAWTFLCEVAFRDEVTPQIEGGRSLLGHLYLGSFFVFALAIPLGCFFWMRWLDWTVKNRLAEGDRRLKRTPSQVVWAYFIPGVNLFRPLADLRRLYSSCARFADDAPAALTVWWVVTLAHLFLMLFDLRGGISPVTAAGSALGVLSQVLALTVLRLFAVTRHGAVSEEEHGVTDGVPDPVPARGRTGTQDAAGGDPIGGDVAGTRRAVYVRPSDPA